MYDYIIENFYINTFHRKINFKELYLISELGQGAFGKVILVKYYGDLYALKSISHLYLQNSSSAMTYLKEEIKNLIMIYSPFVIRLKGFDYDENNCYLLMEYSSSLCLRSAFNWDFSQFKIANCMSIFASMLIGISTIHKYNIVHRDIKPENVIINKDGSIKLIDFGLSKYMKNYTSTIIGTPYYMAPEVIQGNGYDKSIDYWSIAVLVYEMMYRKNPFELKNDINVMNIYKKILKCQVEYPSIDQTNHVNEYKKNEKISVDFDNIKNLLSNMLVKETKKRVSTFNKCKEVLTSYQWDKHMDLDMGFIPFKNFSSLPDHFYNDSDEDKYLINRKYESDLKNAIGIPFKPIYFKHKYSKKYEKYVLNRDDDYFQLLDSYID